MGDPTAVWALRLTDVLGARLDQVNETDLARLVDGGVREDGDLDFKGTHYGARDEDKRELAADIAAMANARGGLIIIGIRDLHDVAVELIPVELTTGQEARIHQIAADNIVPRVEFSVRVVPKDSDPARGYYLLVVPPSTLRPHAVRKEHDFRFPRRDGTTKRWLNEPELADGYRDRFRLAADQVARVEHILDDGLGAMGLDEAAFVAVAVVPTGPGTMQIDLARVSAVQAWARSLESPSYLDGFFESGVGPTAGVRTHRITLATRWESCGRPSGCYAELYEDGAGFACLRTFDPRRPTEPPQDSWILNEDLLYGVGRCLYLLGRHAVQNCGAWGDALVEARLVGRDMRLAYFHRMGPGVAFPELVEGSRGLDRADSSHTLLVEGICSVGSALAASTRLVATDLFHAFGSPEVRQIAPDGTLRARYLGGSTALRKWAEAHGIGVTDEVVPGE